MDAAQHTGMSDIENKSLEAHVSLCQERYIALQRRLDAVESNLIKIETMLHDLSQQMILLAKQNSNKWNTIQLGTIGVLLSVVGFLASRVFV